MLKCVFSLFLLFAFALGLDKQLTSLSANFVQYAKGSGVYYSGFFEALAPYYAKWQYQAPVKKIVYLQEGHLISYEPLLSQVVYIPIQQSLNFFKILQSAKQDLNNPQMYHSTIEGVKYRLWVELDLPKRLEYEDSLGNEVIIEFSNVVLNPRLSKQIFDFTPPKGVDIIKQSSSH